MTRRGIVLGGLAGALACAAAARAAGPEQDVLAAQDKRVALTIAADTAALGAMMTDDLTYTHSSANVDSKADFLEALRSGKAKYKSLSFDERRVRLHGDVAIVSGTCRVQVTSGGKDLDLKLRFTELYAKQAGAWKMALWHSTRVPDPAPAP
jgi:ketosteroid isomerase-like protein